MHVGGGDVDDPPAGGDEAVESLPVPPELAGLGVPAAVVLDRQLVRGIGQVDPREETSRVTHLAWWPARTSGAPVLSGALAWFECQVDDVLESTEQTVALARVQELGHVDGDPLLQVDGGLRGVDDTLRPPLLADTRAHALLPLPRGR